MTVRLTISILLLLQLQLQCSATVFKLTNAVCESFNKSWVEFELCRLRAVSRHKVYLNLNVTLHQPINDIHIKGQLMKKENGYKPWLYSVSFNGCQFIRRRNNPLIKLVWDLFKEYSTLNHTCPYVGQQLIKDFYLRSEKLPTPIPTGEYLVQLTWIINKKPIAATNFYFMFVEDL
ncbi:uncharacterized protein LOC133837340 isoform X2 [Drosophila sulfurigaster albostrigata]|uniref:uncharacterized protein LOC133837340 isoform X2 n=1 Tax=Drosophila sulfurigaster albostrigata TaxID=89887 RepID=UPI002D218839|nr:uncharacterized protein LOC133837340 isoform X2 [Drosophila sulfurigaster albostrigata]